MRITAAVIAGQGTRKRLIDEHILPSLVGFDEVLVVGTHHEGEGYRYLHVPDLTKTTNDALVKRDVAALAATGDAVVYLADDHCVLPDFAADLRTIASEAVVPWDVLVPSRWADHPDKGRIRIPNGEEQYYCAGHGGVFRQRVMHARPWTAERHHPNWDLLISHEHVRDGFKYVSMPTLKILDLEPHNSPWQ